MGFVKKMDLLKWIRKYSTGILDTKTGSMETLIDSGNSKTINYAYTSSVIADDELINTAAPPHQRPMLPPPPSVPQDLPAQQPNDVYDCCVSLDGIPIKHEFQYTLSDTDGCGKITKHDIEGLASKILESMYGNTVMFSSRGQRTVKVTLNVRQSSKPDSAPSSWSRERKGKSSADKLQDYYGVDEIDGAAPAEHRQRRSSSPVYGDAEPLSPHRHHRVKSGAQVYRRDQLVEMVEKSLAENLSFQNTRKSSRPEDYHRIRTRRRQSSASAGTPLLQSTPLPSPPASATKPKTPAKVAWSPYDFEPVAHTPPHHRRRHEKLKNVIRSQQQMYDNAPVAVDKHKVQGKLTSGGRHPHHRTAVVVSSNQHPKDSTTLQEQTKNTDHQRYKRAKLASKKIHHHIHEHHHYHHYDYYIV